MRKLTPTEKFYLSTHKNSNGCWIWNGCKNKRGYGQINLGKEGKILAHRFSYKIHFDNYSSELVVCHKCDVPSCVNPNHLFQGTQKDNLQDMRKKGRHYKGKLTPAKISVIRSGKHESKHLAEKYGVCVQYINRVKQLKHKIR